MFDTSGFTEVSSNTFNGWTTKYYIDYNGNLVGKTCGGCHSILSISHFSKDSSRKYGVQPRCTACNKSKMKRHNDKKVSGTSNRSRHNKNRVESHRNRTSSQVMESRNRLRPDGVKTCTKCKTTLGFTYFPDDSSKPDGLSYVCKTCIHSYRSTVSRRLRDNSTNRKRRLALSARSEEEIAIAQSKLYPDGTKICSDCSESLVLSYFYRSKHLLGGLSPSCKSCLSVSRALKYRNRNMWERRGIPLVCYVCGSTSDIHSDHVVPKALGGSDDIHNRLPLCGHHNQSKGKTPLTKWLRLRHPEILGEVLYRVTVEYGVSITPY